MEGFFRVLNSALATVSFAMVAALAWRFSSTSTKVEAMWAWFMNERLHSGKWNGVERRGSVR